MRTDNYKDLIEQYLVGTISDGDKAMLDSKLASDASIRSELKVQSEMVEGLKQYRKAQLKARLDAVPVETGLFDTAGQSTVVKVAATVGVALVLIGGLYYYSETRSEEVATFERLTPMAATEEPASKPDLTIEKLAPVKSPDKPREQVSASAPQKKVSVVADKAVEVEASEPSFSKPSVVEFESEEDFEAENIDTDNKGLVAEAVDAAKSIDVEISPAAGKENRLQYQFYEEKLHLFGDFNKVPYEILEINNKEGKRVYLYHEGVYYQLFYPTREVRDLQKISNESLLKELTIFRENKALN